jgi:methanogenic corrinoid protein MtbC1
MPHRGFVSRYVRAVLDKDRQKAQSLILDLARSKDNMTQIFDVIAEAQMEIGKLWARNVISVADEHFATQVALDTIAIVANQFRSRRAPPSRERTGNTLLLSCVEGEYHYVGLKMFAEILANYGWNVQFLGPSVPLAEVLKSVRARGKPVDLVCLSITMSFNMSILTDTIKQLRREPLLSGAKIVVGGSLFKSRKLRESLTREYGKVRLADYVSTSLADGLQYASGLASLNPPLVEA